MSEIPTPLGESATAASRPLWLRWTIGAENTLTGIVLFGMLLLPLLEIALRKFFGTGITGSSSFVQHLTLLVGVLGGALAARDNRLLSLSNLPNLFPARLKDASLIFSSGLAVAITTILCVSAWEFVQKEPADKLLAYGISYRVFQIFLPVGFALVAVRICWHSSPSWPGRAICAGWAAALVWFVAKSGIAPEKLVWPALIALGLATLLGAPLFTALGGVAMILLWGSGLPVSIIPLEHYYLVTDAVLPSIPLFTLAGYFLAEGGASRRLVRVFQSVVGPFRGGPGIVTALVCAFFTSFTGASGVTILALGGLLMPVLLQARYSDKSALGLITGAGSLGILFPPCLPLILYAVIAQRTIQNLELPVGVAAPEVTINRLFLGGIGPGILMVILTAGWAIWTGPRDKAERPRLVWREALGSLWEAKWELMLPVIVLGVLLGGLATPVEAAAVAALYAFITQVIIHRDLHIVRDVPRVLAECGLLIGGVLLILGVAMGLTKYLIFADVPTLGVEWIKGSIESPLMFLLFLNLVLLVVGCLMDVYSAIVVVVPLIVPMGIAYGIDPIHLGIIFLANLQLGFLTPPVGMNLFLASYRFNKPMSYVTRATLPMIAVLGIGVILVTYIPAMTMWLPKILK
jgi:tripartite ATP-independent transporter DctM subunit